MRIPLFDWFHGFCSHTDCTVASSSRSVCTTKGGTLNIRLGGGGNMYYKCLAIDGSSTKMMLQVTFQGSRYIFLL